MAVLHPITPAVCVHSHSLTHTHTKSRLHDYQNGYSAGGGTDVSLVLLQHKNIVMTSARLVELVWTAATFSVCLWNAHESPSAAWIIWVWLVPAFSSFSQTESDGENMKRFKTVKPNKNRGQVGLSTSFRMQWDMKFYHFRGPPVWKIYNNVPLVHTVLEIWTLRCHKGLRNLRRYLAHISRKASNHVFSDHCLVFVPFQRCGRSKHQF